MGTSVCWVEDKHVDMMGSEENNNNIKNKLPSFLSQIGFLHFQTKSKGNKFLVESFPAPRPCLRHLGLSVSM